ncbi:MAG: bifunctional oligoribonuclease/PAP phosphatase NrnA [Candidatus Omnitrophota bacterium]
MGKSAFIVNHDSVPQEYSFLKGTELMMRYRHKLGIKFEVLVMLDCSDQSRCGCVYGLAASGQQVMNIDHHISNTKFADINWVLPRASSVSEMIHLLYKAMHIRLDIDTATALYAGILTDTGSFRYVNTTSLTHRLAAELLKFDLDVYKIYRNIYGSLSFSDISLLLNFFSTLQRDSSGKIISFQVKQQLLKGRKVHFDLSENILNFGRLIRGCEVCVIFKELRDKTDQVRVNLRSQGKVDVNRVAQFFGGGGHKTASGSTIKGSLQTVKRRVIKKIKEQL